MKTRLLLALPLLAFVACRDNRASIQVQAVCSPTKDCMFKETCDAQYIGFTTIDAGLSERLWLFLQVANQHPDNADEDIRRVNTNDAHLDQVLVEYEGIALPRAVYELPNYRVPAGGTAVVSVDVIPEASGAGSVLQSFSTSTTPRDMVANVRLRGYLDDGSRFETGEFPIGVRVCDGCLDPDPCGTAVGTCPPNQAGMLPLTCRE